MTVEDQDPTATRGTDGIASRAGAAAAAGPGSRDAGPADGAAAGGSGASTSDTRSGPPAAASTRPPGDRERYAGLFAQRTRVMKSSAMRDLMALTERPEVISLAGGLADTTLFPAEDLAKVLSHMAAGDSARALQYAPTEGMAEIRPCLAEVMAAEGTIVDPDDILVTTGGQQVIDLVCKTLVDPGDVIVAEAPTYPGAVPTFSAYEADLVQVEMDDDGMRIDVLEETLDRLEAEGRRPKFIYTIPTFQNPGGVTMSLERRHALVKIAQERQILVLEDNPYGLLRYEGDPLPTLLSLDGGRFVIYAGTLSKILSPGIRVGWAVAPAPVRQKMVIGKAGSDLNSSSMSQLFVAYYFKERDWRDYVRHQSAVYQARRDVMLEALERHMPDGTTWTRPKGGLFVWLTLPDYLDTTDLLARALQHNVAFVPGRGAFLDGRGGNSMRINFSGVGEDDIREGISRIGSVIAEQLELYASIAGTARPRGRSTRSGSGDARTSTTTDDSSIVPLRTAGRRRGTA
ncbi:PLP-dependent aminotransferase family protein [Patulibacter sp.]|uniref:aminotransferase-like domain-containing protein n=1 Tax=Patulibacter sp. TaxID=1912859 RepID=UPI00272212DF|nr:PLP-dependent aminotransferase family protein [Patulibacter sp.]MDO9410143.1 PLP-dependent aminotransferase family protein [Patulibacter sp.]